MRKLVSIIFKHIFWFPRAVFALAIMNIGNEYYGYYFHYVKIASIIFIITGFFVYISWESQLPLTIVLLSALVYIKTGMNFENTLRVDTRAYQ